MPSSDLIMTVQAEDVPNFKMRLGKIKVPTLVITKAKNPCSSEALTRETAA